MGEFMELISMVKRDKDKFNLLVDKMEPLISKYVRLLYKDDKEDVREEFLLALWEAVCNISFFDNDGQIVRYLTIALRNRYMELYKSSRRFHDYEVVSEDSQEVIQNTVYNVNEFDEMLLKTDIFKLINNYQGVKKRIIYLMLIDNLTDSEISGKLSLSRQYINRIRKKLRDKVKEEHLIV